jgi:uncharacterized protein
MAAAAAPPSAPALPVSPVAVAEESDPDSESRQAVPGLVRVHFCAYVMRYEWDPGKAESNRRKHGVRFADAVAAFADESALALADPDAAEDRYVTIGMDALARLVVGVFTWRGPDTIRLISARRATRREAAWYAGGET